MTDCACTKAGRAPYEAPRHFKRIGLNDTFSSIVGDQDYLRAQYGLDTNGIVNAIQLVLGQ